MQILKLQAVGDLFRRYGSVFKLAWSIRDQLESPVRERHELAFLPANLELADTPSHPAARWTMRTLMVLAALTAIVAIFGRLDIVAVAKGKLLPDERVKTIQPAITGVVRQIFVRDGQRVTAGQSLIQLDATQAIADSDKAHASRIDAGLAVARAQALLSAQTDHKPPVLAPVAGAATDRQIAEQRFTEGLYHEYKDKLDSAQAQLMKRQAELDTTRQEVAKLTATAPIARQQADRYKALATDKYVAETDYLDKEKAALEQEHELAAQRSHAVELSQSINEQNAQVASTTSQFRSTQLDALEKATQQFEQSRNDETKAVTRKELLTLTSPVDGTVQQLQVHTLGGVATAAQSIMEIVPDDTIEVEANIENKDIGFVKVGQRATVKIDAFPYTRYGFMEGQVVSVSNDAVQDKKLGLTFVSRIRLPSNRIKANGQWIHLTPGMSVTAEIKTGKRSVAQYFLEPVLETTQESMRER